MNANRQKKRKSEFKAGTVWRRPEFRSIYFIFHEDSFVHTDRQGTVNAFDLHVSTLILSITPHTYRHGYTGLFESFFLDLIHVPKDDPTFLSGLKAYEDQERRKHRQHRQRMRELKALLK